MTVYHVAPSLQALLREVNERWPNRDKSSDGALGDAAHAARESDHNPDYTVPPPRYGVVRARDIDKDGIDVQQLIRELRRECLADEPRVAYVIYDHQMMRSYPKTLNGKVYLPGIWAPYDGLNPHEGHLHVSINHTAAAENDTSPWFRLEDDDMTVDELLNAHITGKAEDGTTKDFGTLRGVLWTLMARTADDDSRMSRIEAKLNDLVAKS